MEMYSVWIAADLCSENTDCEMHGERKTQANTEVESEGVKGEGDLLESLKKDS